ncbi:MAG: hypothetical protein L0I76_28555, partial [Pseudonocardia sp.]|nr:hypothetical protein [Pseudonocardia sp.]
SPSGRRYRSPRIIGPVVTRRAALGLPTTYETAVMRAVEVDRAAAEAEDVGRFWARLEAVEPESRWHRDKQRQAAS